MNKETNKKQIKVASGREEYVTKSEFFEELREIEKDVVKEVKKILNNKKEKIIFQDQQAETKKEDSKITNLEVQKDKLVAQLNDGRELSIPIAWFAKWGIENVTTGKLKKYEIWRGKNIYFPEINEVLGVEKFINGFDASC